MNCETIRKQDGTLNSVAPSVGKMRRRKNEQTSLRRCHRRPEGCLDWDKRERREITEEGK